VSLFIPPKPTVAKAILGPGAAAMQTQPWLTSGGRLASQKLMAEAAGFWKADPWIRSAERVISGKFATVEWHLEDAEDTEVDDAYPDKRYQAVRDLFERPQALITEGRQMTRRELWSLTSRHMGACGNAFWYLDQREPVAGTPLAVLYVAPWRMMPAEDRAGNLTGWVLDYSEASGTGTPLELREVLHFTLEPPDVGHFGVGLVESAYAIVNLDRVATGHVTSQLASGGRLAGIVSPKSDSIPDDKFQQLVRDFRTIVEQPDAAKRVNILQGPVDFVRSAANPQELQLLELMNKVRDDILALWGVPLSQVGGTTPAGMNSGDIRKYDEAALWQNAIHPRLVSFGETVQYQLLDRYKALGMTVELEIEEPEFDDDGPRFDLLAKAVNLPMRNDERRALIGLDPFGDPALDNAIYLPTLLVQVGTAPGEDGLPVTEASLGREGTTEEATASPIAADVPVKAKLPANPLQRGLTSLRARIERTETPALRSALATYLAAQRREIATRLRTTDAGRLKGDPHSILPKRWDDELAKLLGRPLATMALAVDQHITAALRPTKAAPVSAADRARERAGRRVKGINDTTRAKIAEAIGRAIDEGDDVLTVADAVETAGSAGGLDLGSLFSELRAETIARTELMDAYNGAAIGSYGDAGITQVQAIDGDDDPECAERDGQVFDIDEAEAIEDHPNGTLDWAPVVEAEEGEGKALLKAVLELSTRSPVVNNYVYPADVHVDPTTVHVQPPDVNVYPPDVTVQPATVTVNVPREERARTKRIVRNERGEITGVVEE
jgi:phage portal protein BeeE